MSSRYSSGMQSFSVNYSQALKSLNNNSSQPVAKFASEPEPKPEPVKRSKKAAKAAVIEECAEQLNFIDSLDEPIEDTDFTSLQPHSNNSDLLPSEPVTGEVVRIPQGCAVEEPQNEHQANPSRIYGENWVVMQNKLVYSISNLALDERRMILFLSPIVRRAIDINPDQKMFTIKVKDYAKEYELTNKNIYAKLKKQSVGLQSKNFFIWLFDANEKEALENSISWSKKTRYKPKKGEIEIELDEVVIQMLTIFDKNHPYTKYSRKLLVNLNSYALILLELVASFEDQRNKQKEFTVEYLREKFGCVNQYEKTAEFIRNVLKTAAASLKKNSHYIVDYTTKAKHGGRRVTHIVLNLSYKPTAPKDVVEDKSKASEQYVRKTPLTKAQIAKIGANKEPFIDANKHLISKNNNKEYGQIFAEWEPLLADSKSVSKFKYINVLLSAQKGDDVRARLVELGVKI